MAKTVKKSTKAEAKKSSKEKAKPKKAVEAKPEKKAKEPAAKKEKSAAPKKEVSEKPAKKSAAPKVIVEIEKPAAVVKPPAVAKIGKREKAALAAIEKTTADELKKWTDYKQKYGAEKALPYSMSSVYEAGKPLQHKVLGWGYIINVQNDRLEVLFENGPKMLISNYKSS